MQAQDPQAIRLSKRLASDIGALNQKACVCARVVYVQSGTDEAGLANLHTFGRYVYDAEGRRVGSHEVKLLVAGEGGGT